MIMEAILKQFQKHVIVIFLKILQKGKASTIIATIVVVDVMTSITTPVAREWQNIQTGLHKI